MRCTSSRSPSASAPALADLFRGGRLEDAESHALRVRRHAGQGAAERERLLVLEAEPLGHHRRPQR
jgi:hypothetical protein